MHYFPAIIVFVKYSCVYGLYGLFEYSTFYIRSVLTLMRASQLNVAILLLQCAEVEIVAFRRTNCVTEIRIVRAAGMRCRRIARVSAGRRDAYVLTRIQQLLCFD